ncbi:gliding motility protein RemB [Mucilaginibacter sp. 44-25]|uniref:gliding motility protein RemB n=1 Tax=Mucilaginibacter sp. 44-25 TaxID=1895794 RepID=UPI000966667A|nr:gliding motility protein RemB [Mucilaginibacter sp. 44-25]OJW16492.1 MAG: gliding motility protein RemB [Mucilaginibacter sp. 44-25]
MKKIFISISLLLAVTGVARSQALYQPYSYQLYQKFDAENYSTKTRLHTALKPSLIGDSVLMRSYDSIMNYGRYNGGNALYNKLFNEHQVDVKGSNSTFYADLLPDFNIGRDFSHKQNTWLSSLGLQVGGTIGNKFYYNVTGFLNRSEVPDYISTYIRQVGIVPGMAYAGTYNNNPNAYAWDYITAIASYTPNKYINITAGRDKNFIGDGYRSLLLSDYASPYPFFKLTANLGNVRYMAMWAYFNDPANTSQLRTDQHKFGVFHYLDWNVSNRLSLGFYDSVIWGNVDDKGHVRGFDFNYINPVIFLRPIEAASGSPDNALIGITTKYKITDGITAYGQFSLDEFTAKEFFGNSGYLNNKFGYQVGFRGPNLFGVKNLNYLVETNTVRPYTYSERYSILNYSENSEPLAHPWGANFREVVGLLSYSINRFDLMGEIDYGHYGLDANGINYGKDIFKNYTEAPKLYGNNIAQGLATNMVYLQGKVAYLINPKYNLRLELGGIYRTEKNTAFNDKTAMVTFGIRSSFRNIYTDLASYKTH